MRTSHEIKHAIADFSRLHAPALRTPSSSAPAASLLLGRLSVDRDVWLDIGDEKFKRRLETHFMQNVAWKFHAPKVFVIGKVGIERSVPENDMVIQRRLDSFDEALLVNQAADGVLVLNSRRDDVVLL